MKKFRFSAVSIFLVLAFCSARAQYRLEHVASTLYSGVPTSIIVVGDYLYCGHVDGGLQIFALPDSGSPTFVAYRDIDASDKLYLSDTILFSASGYLTIYNVRDAASPVMLSAYEPAAGNASDIAITGNYACIQTYEMSWGLGLEIIDISNLQNPQRVFADTIWYIAAVTARQNFLYYTQYSMPGPWGVYSVNITDPANPVFGPGTDTGPYPQDIAISGEYAFVANMNYITSLHVLEPYEISWVDTLQIDHADQIKTAGNYAYLNSYNGLSIVNISNPADLTLVGEVSFPGDFLILDQHVNDIYAAIRFTPQYDEAILRISVTDPANPTITGRYDMPGFCEDMFLAGNYAYVANGTSGLRVIDVSDPEHPEARGNIDIQSQAIDVFIDSQYAYLVAKHEGLLIYDISNPVAPVQVGSWDTLAQDEPAYVYVQGDFAYLTRGTLGYYDMYLVILDIADRAHPRAITYYHELDEPNFIHVNGNLAYVSCRDSLVVLDVSNPQSPVRLGAHAYGAIGRKIAVEGSYVYAIGYNMFEIIDVSNPAIPHLTGSIDQTGGRDISVYGDYAFIGPVIRMIDVSDPAAPRVIATCDSIRDQGEIFVADDYIFVPAFDRFSVLRLTPTAVDDDEYLPDVFSLSQNYPNPFNARTTISYSLPADFSGAVSIFDITGRMVRTLDIAPGSSRIIWDGTNLLGQPVSSGIYFYGISGHRETMRKMVLLR